MIVPDQSDPLPIRKLMRPREVAQIFGVTTTTVKRWSRERGLFTQYEGGYDRSEVMVLARKRGLLPTDQPDTAHTTGPRPSYTNVYPEHEKVARHKTESQAAGEFLEWLTSEAGYRMVKVTPSGKLVRDEDDNPVACIEPIQDLLAAWLGVDLEAFRLEKEAMLERIREENS